MFEIFLFISQKVTGFEKIIFTIQIKIVYTVPDCGDVPTEKGPYPCRGAFGGKNARKTPVLLHLWPRGNNFTQARKGSGSDFTSRERRAEASQLLKDNQKMFKGVGGP
jgi:hypothetical protein